MNNLEKVIYDEVSKIINGTDLEIFSCEEVNENNMKLIRTLLDSNHTIDIDEVTSVIEKLQEVVEREDLIPDEYFLEVSSVGCEKPLRNIDEILNNLGQYVYVEFKEPVNDSYEYYGTLDEIMDNDITIKVNVKGRIKRIDFNYDNIKFIRLAIKF